MLTNFCRKCMKALCVCVATASIVGSLPADAQTVQLSDHAVGSILTTGVTGTAGQTYVVHDQITDQEYVGVWPDQRPRVVLGPTGPGLAGDSLRLKVVSASGPPGRRSGGEFPKGPTGAAG
jgi:hypothetical protein